LTAKAQPSLDRDSARFGVASAKAAKKNYRIVTSLERTLAAGAWDETRRRRNHAESTESRTFFGLRDPACIDEPQRDRIIKAFP